MASSIGRTLTSSPVADEFAIGTTTMTTAGWRARERGGRIGPRVRGPVEEMREVHAPTPAMDSSPVGLVGPGRACPQREEATGLRRAWAQTSWP